MPRRLDSVNQGGYMEAIEVIESELEAVVSMLGTADPQISKSARDRIYALLEDLKAARSQTASAKTIRDDIRDLDQLAETLDPERMTERLRPALDALETLEARNPVLRRRLQWLSPRHSLHDQLISLQVAEEAIFAIGRDISTKVSVLKEEFSSEDGRGRHPDRAALAFTSGLYDVWTEFTERGTSRQNAPDREKDPFGDFVEAAGRLIFPDFKGGHLARQIHERRKQPPRGEK